MKPSPWAHRWADSSAGRLPLSATEANWLLQRWATPAAEPAAAGLLPPIMLGGVLAVLASQGRAPGVERVAPVALRRVPAGSILLLEASAGLRLAELLGQEARLVWLRVPGVALMLACPRQDLQAHWSGLLLRAPVSHPRAPD